MPNLPPLKLRAREPGDDPLIYSSWINQATRLPPLLGTDPRAHRFVVAALLDRSQCVVACNPSDGSHIYGYVVAEAPDVLHFVYVRNTFRRWGIGAHLVASLLPGFKQQTTYVTHNARALSHLLAPWQLQFNPYKVMR